MLEFRILGPLEVACGSEVLALGGAKQRALLACLVLHPNEVVSSDRLLEDVWGDDAPATARKIVQLYVSRLRKTLGEGVLLTRAPGYELRVDPGQVDAIRFERLYEEGASALGGNKVREAAAALRAALALWSGPALADFLYEPFAQGEAARLEELRLTALEARIEADLELGRHADLVGELEAMVAENPLRERLRCQLLLALYRCGRQAEALDAYQSARGTLVEQLGIEPGRELRELQQAILRQDPALEKAAAVEIPDVPRTVFVGRQRELAGLAGALDDVLTGRTRLVLVAGEPGIGKSRLVEELLWDARARGARILVGRCWEAGGAPAYWPWVQSLRALVRETEPARLRPQLGSGAVDLAQLLPELRDLYPDLPEPPAPESEGARFRLFEAVSALLTNAAGAQPLVLVLDDVHAADEPSLLLLEFVARTIGDARLLVICAYRDVDPMLRDPLIGTLAQLVREPKTTHLALAGLSEEDVGGYIVLAAAAASPPELVEAIHAETEGNALFMTEVVRLLEAEGRLGDAAARLDIPAGVRAVIARRVGRLPEHCRSTLVLAAVLGREFDLQALAQLRRVELDQLLRMLDDAMAERIVTEVPGSHGRLRFGHALIRDTLYDDLTAARRIQLHRDAGDALKFVYGGNLAPHLAELAHHYYEAASAGGAPETAIEYARRAADRAASQLAFEEAVRLYDLALALADEPRSRCDLLLGRGDALARAGDTSASKEALREAADIADQLGLPEQLARAALAYGSRFLWDVSRDDDTLAPLISRALTAIGTEDSPLRVRLLARLAAGPLRDVSFGAERRRVVGKEALDMARRIGDPGTLAYALAGYIAANHAPTFSPTQVTVATELIQVARRTGDLEREMEGYEHRGTAQMELGDMAAARLDLEKLATLAAELHQPAHDWIAGVYRSLVALNDGDLARAEELIATTRSLGERAQSWSAAVSHGLQLYVLRREQGRLGEIEGLVRRSVSEYPTYPIWRCVLAQATAELGHLPEARAVLGDLARDDFGELSFDEEWLTSMGLLAEAAQGLEAVDNAPALYRLLLPFQDRVAVAYPEISIGAVARYLGVLATLLERFDDAERHFEDALALNERIGARTWLARAETDYASMLRARDGPDDSERAAALEDSAATAARELGMSLGSARAASPSAPSRRSKNSL